MRKRLIAILLVAASACQQQRQQPNPLLQAGQLSYEGADYKTQAAKVAHGKRLADILDCTGCHGSNLQGKDMADKPEEARCIRQTSPWPQPGTATLSSNG